MRRALIAFCVLVLDASLAERAAAAPQACAWIVETVETDGSHMFHLNLSVDAPASVSVRFHGTGFTSASKGGDMIALEPGAPQEIDGEGFDVMPGDDVHFDVGLFDHPLNSVDEMKSPTGKPLATYDFDGKVGEDSHVPPAAFAKQCRSLG